MSFGNSVTKNDMLSKSNQANNLSNVLHLNYERDRLKTFEPWTNSVDKENLAKFGFYYEGPADCVKCIYCGVIIARWNRGDDPLREHMRWSESCPFLLRERNKANVAIEPNFETQLPLPDYIVPIKYNTDDVVDEPTRPTQKVLLEGPYAIRHPNYSSKEERLKSFESWPKSLIPTPEALSEAGLYYLGVGDQCKCFYCGGALRDWEDDDDPWVEHAKFFGNCEYVRQNKGEQFFVQAKLLIVANEDVSTMNDPYNDTNDTEIDDSTSAKCNICLVGDLDVIFLPCMHVYACAKCGFAVTHCPVCRQKIIELSKCQVGAGEQRPTKLEFVQPKIERQSTKSETSFEI